MGISTMTYDQFFITAVGISSSLMVCSAAWIVRVLIQIEKSKVVALSSVLEDDGTGNSDLQFEESTSESGGKQLEVEPDDIPSGGAIEMCPTGSSKKSQSSPKSSPNAKPMTARKARQKQRRISWMFLNIQIASVSALVLLTYLLLVQSNAAIFLRMLGSITVFGVFLRFQIGEEVRRQRVDRIMLLLSLFLVIASMLSMLVYSMKELAQGEIYEGPARIIGYDQDSYNNTKHDPTSRTDMTVAWGREWGCPWSGGKVCSANIQGAMCQTHPDKENTKHKPHYDNRKRILDDGQDQEEKDAQTEAEEVEYDLEEDMEEEEEEAEEVEDALEEDLEEEEKSNQELVKDNEDLENENEMLQEEIEELKEENEVEDEENEELVDQENSELDEIVDEYDEDIMIMEEEEYEEAQDYEDSEYEEEENSLEKDIEDATDDEQKEELTEEFNEDKEEKEELDEEYEEDEELLDEYADEYADAADESYSDFVDEQDETYDLEEEKEELEEEVEETEAELDEIDSEVDDIDYEVAEEMYDEEEEEIEEEFEEDDGWYWDEWPDYYDDDYYEDEYWNYDWDSVWGDYACEDLFDADIGGQTYDVDVPAGGDDEWPFVNIYGSCKTCEAYILDYFAEEAFEETQEYKQQAIVYMAGAVAGFIWTILSYIQYRVLPTSENEIELLGTDGGVMA